MLVSLYRTCGTLPGVLVRSSLGEAVVLCSRQSVEELTNQFARQEHKHLLKRPTLRGKVHLHCGTVVAMGTNKTQRFEDYAQEANMVLHAVGGEIRDRSWPLIRKGGVLASLLPPPPNSSPRGRLVLLTD